MTPTLRPLGAALRGAADTVVLLEEMDSTHALALRLIDQMADEDFEVGSCLLLALEQGGGLGRGERSWVSPPGGLYLNWIRSGVARETVASLPILAGAAVLAALEAQGLEGAGLKWPNDVLVGGAKLAGVLSHARSTDPAWITVGLGVNLLTAPEVAGDRPATCLADHLPPQDFVAWAGSIVSVFTAHLERGLADPTEAMELWRSRMVHRPGEPLEVRLASGEVHRGRYAGLTPQGYLRLLTSAGEQVITSGDVLEGDG